MAFSTLFLDASSDSGTMDGIKDMVSDLSQTIGVDLFEEDIDNVVFQTNEFLCNSDFIGSQGPFWWILQMSMALGAMFSIIVDGGMDYKMMVKNEPKDNEGVRHCYRNVLLVPTKYEWIQRCQQRLHP